MKETRSDFWKCRYNFRMPMCGMVNTMDEQFCHRCGHEPPVDPSEAPATNAEVIAAWLLASDERRKELEIASRPTKPGEYRRYTRMIYPGDGTLGCILHTIKDLTNYDKGWLEYGLWEPIE